MTPPLVLELELWKLIKFGKCENRLQFRNSYLPVRLCYCDRTCTKMKPFPYTLWWSPHCWWHPIQVWSNPVLKLTIIMKDVNQGELQDRSMHSSPGNQCCMAIAKASSSYRYPWPKCKNFMEHQQLAKGHGVLPPNQLPRGQLPPGQLPPDQLPTPTRSTPDPPDQFNSIQNY